jgi:tetratricopeptide (TPR) repeat protein
MNDPLIHKYLDGLLDNQENAAFEAQLENDPNLTKELLLLKEMRRHTSQNIQTGAASAMIKDVGRSFAPSSYSNTVSINKKSNWRYYIPLAAAAVLILGLFIRPLFNSSPIDNINYEASPLSFQVRGVDSNELYHLSAEAFNNKDYPVAINHLTKLIESNQEVDKARLYKSIALLKTEKHSEARKELQQLEAVDLFDNASFYYQGLSHLDTGNSKEAMRLFNLVKENSSYYKRAKKRINQISSVDK